MISQFQSGPSLTQAKTNKKSVLKKYVDKATDSVDSETPTEDLDFVVDVIAASEKFQLKRTIRNGKLYLLSTFLLSVGAGRHHHYGAEMFSVEHIRKLQPFIINQEIELPIDGVSDEELRSTLFPKYFCEKVSHIYEGRNILKAIEVCGTTSSIVNGKYTRCNLGRGQFYAMKGGESSWDGIVRRCCVDRFSAADGDWAIACSGTGKVLWKCPNSQNLECPPIGPWIPVAPEVRDDTAPTIKYIKYCSKVKA